MTDKACEICTKRHDTGHIVAGGSLECRARPPSPDVMVGQFPKVRNGDYCHSDFELDAAAQAARDKQAAETRQLDRLVSATQARAAEVAPVAPDVPAAAIGRGRSRRQGVEAAAPPAAAPAVDALAPVEATASEEPAPAAPAEAGA